MQRVTTQKNALSQRKSFSLEIDTRSQLRALLSSYKNKQSTRPSPIPRHLYQSQRTDLTEHRLHHGQNSIKNCKLPAISPKRKQLKVKQLNSFQHHIISNYLNFNIKIKGSDSVTLKERKSSKKLNKNKLKIKIQKQNPTHQTNTIHEAALETIRNRENFHSIESKKEYSLKEEPMKHYVHQKMQRKKREWKEQDPLQMETYFAEAIRKTEHKIDMVAQKTFHNPIVQKIETRIPAKSDLPAFIKKYVPKNSDVKMIELIKSPLFSVEYGQNSLFIGEISSQQREGIGIEIKNGCIFEGTWKKGYKFKGVQITEYGEYNGMFKNDKKQGKGQFRWPNGQFYSGEWREGKRHGVGMWTSPKGDSYMGEWKKGVVEGEGVHKSLNSQKYQGAFKNFLKHGFGKQSFPNGDRYQGQYVQGLANGQGIYYWSDGTIYEGHFSKGLRDGKGTLKNGKGLNFRGEFKQETADGECEIDYGNGETYKGTMKGSKRNGKGTLRNVANRRIFQGYWKNNEFVTLQQSKQSS